MFIFMNSATLSYLIKKEITQAMSSFQQQLLDAVQAVKEAQAKNAADILNAVAKLGQEQLDPTVVAGVIADLTGVAQGIQSSNVTLEQATTPPAPAPAPVEPSPTEPAPGAEPDPGFVPTPDVPPST